MLLPTILSLATVVWWALGRRESCCWIGDGDDGCRGERDRTIRWSACEIADATKQL